MSEEINIRHIAKLARLHIDEAEIGQFSRRMAEMVAMVEKLPEFEKTDLPLREQDAMPLREDEIKPSSPREKILQNAPQVEAGCIVVPKVVEE